jgi:hypothetical protein
MRSSSEDYRRTPRRATAGRGGKATARRWGRLPPDAGEGYRRMQGKATAGRELEHLNKTVLESSPFTRFDPSPRVILGMLSTEHSGHVALDAVLSCHLEV